MGKECFHTYKHLDITEEDKRETKHILCHLKKHFDPTRNVAYERFVFNSITQDRSETIYEYLNKLQELAATCEFGTLHDDMIRDRIVIGTKDGDARARMLRESSKLTLNKAIEICKTSEVTQKQLKKFETTELEEINFTSKYKKRPSKDKNGTEEKRRESSNKTCQYCVGQHERNKCPAYGETCRVCNKQNHFARVCRQRKYKRRVHMIAEEETDSEHDQSSSGESVLQIEHSIESLKGKGKQWFAALKLRSDSSHEYQLSCQLDCGATCNVIRYNDLCKICQDGKPRLQPSCATLKLYGGHIIKPRGQCRLYCNHNDKSYTLEFQIIDTNQKPLLSGDTCQTLGLLTVNVPETVHTMNMATTILIYSVKTPKPSVKKMSANTAKDRVYQYTSPLTQDKILSDYRDVFQGLGCLPGQYHLQVDQSVKPIKHQPRKVAVALKSELKKKIESLEKQKILTKVPEPTDWISSMVVVKNPGKLRIRKDLNKALKRSHYPMPTIKDIHLAKAKVFSVLDAKDGFWQVKLDKESSYLTTMWTPLGRYRWLCMPFGIATAPKEYQRQQHEDLEGLDNVEVIADDIIVTYEDTVADHDKCLIGLLDRAKQINLKLNKKKMRLLLKSVPWMGHLFTDEGPRPDPENIKAIIEIPKPNDIQAVQRLIGFATYLSRFLPHLSDVCKSLRHLTDKDAVWCWQT
ncbi:uncharacterized protein LOC144450650 [Glandiceps talaboti]